MRLPNLGGLSLRADTKAHPCFDDALCASDPSDSEEEPPKEEYTDRDMPDVPDEASDEEVLDSGVLGDSYMEALDNHRRRKLELATSKIGVDEVMLVLEAISRNDASKADICEQVMDWCSVNKTNYNGCKEAGSDFWYNVMTRVFPFEIFAPFTKVSSRPVSWTRWTNRSLWENRASPDYQVDITSFFNVCYGYSLADTTAKDAYEYLLRSARRYYKKNQRLAEANHGAVNHVTGVSVTSYSILNVLDAEISKANLATFESEASEAHYKLYNTNRLFKRIVEVFLKSTDRMLFRLHDQLIFRPSKEDPPGVDTTNETYPLVRLRAVANLLGIHAVRMWKCMSLLNRYPLLKGWSSIRTLYYTLHKKYRTKFFKTLFPSLITHRNEGIYSLPLDRHGDHLDEAMYRLFTKRANSVVYLVRGPGSIILGLVNDVDTDYNSDND